MAAGGPPPPVNKGYYTRPSAAFEQGGGFYVPGLEGAKLRLVAACVLSGGLLLNRLLSPGEAATSQLGSEALGTLGITLLFAQVATQAKQEREQESLRLRAAIAARVKEQKEVSTNLPPALADAAVWAAETLLRLTPALGVVWLVEAPTLHRIMATTASKGGADGTSEPGLLVRIGRFPDEVDVPRNPGSETLLGLLGTAETADYTFDESSGEKNACAPLPRNSACAVLHRCCDGGVLAIASERPAAFSANHRRWLASMARYIEGSC